MSAYYNENDTEKASWLRELIKANVIAPGDVDERSIVEVKTEDLRIYTQCHFFAGIGVWSYSLRLAGWPDDRPVWTGSCPCPSFSCAGKGTGFDDPRHLWPSWFGRIRKCKPAVIFGEQSDDAIGYGWLDLVQTDLESETYAVGKAVLGACSVGAPHIRQRLYFVAHSEEAEVFARFRKSFTRAGTNNRKRFGECSTFGELANADSGRCAEERHTESGSRHSGRSTSHQLADANRRGQPMRWLPQTQHDGEQRSKTDGYVNGFWRNADWVLRKRWNRDDFEWCPAEPGTFPLASGVANRVLKLRGYGDAICAELAKAFIEAYLSI